MSAAATAAGYLYASGRLRGRAQREHENHGEPSAEQRADKPAERPARPRIERPRREVRVAALPEVGQPQPRQRRTPIIQYRTRRWKPETHDE